uniref:Uncharacterized protein n=1 Tax=Lepeophtheirus salmonis TaxID=72036 RepID=A0A0K2UTT4_LEPSM
MFYDYQIVIHLVYMAKDAHGYAKTKQKNNN